MLNNNDNEARSSDWCRDGHHASCTAGRGTHAPTCGCSCHGERPNGIIVTSNPRPAMTYSTIVADPPWRQAAGPGFDGRAHDTKVKRNVGTRTNSKTRPLPYPTMSSDEIAELPVTEWADPDAHLYLWVTNRYIEDGYRIARAWGFRPVTLLTWCKKPMGMGLGGAFVQTTEHILFCRRGKLATQARMDTTWWQVQRPYLNGSPAHSMKPECFLDIVEQVSPGPYLEMFSRRARLGWDTWGNESLHGGEAVPNRKATA